MSPTFYSENDIRLYHHGILGMKWGVRRYQNKDGSLTTAGRAHYGYKLNEDDRRVLNQTKTAIKSYFDLEKTRKHKQELYKAEYKKKHKRADEMFADNYAYRQYEKNDREKDYAQIKQNFKDIKLTDKQKKTIAIVAGTAIAAAGAYAAYRYLGKNYLDRTLSSKVSLQTLTSFEDRTKNGTAFYAAFEKSDKTIYKGLYGRSGTQGYKFMRLKGTYAPKLNAQSKIVDSLKVASVKSSEREFIEMCRKDPAFANAVYSKIHDSSAMLGMANPKYMKVVAGVGIHSKPTSGWRTGELKNLYTLFNAQINQASVSDEAAAFYKHMKSKGYGALIDVNDLKFSGYGSKAPVIVFDMDKVVTDTVEKLSETELNKAENYMAGKYLFTEIASITGIGAGLSTASKISNVENANTDVLRKRSKR